MSPVYQSFQSAPSGKRVVLATAISMVATIVVVSINFYAAAPKMNAMPEIRRVGVVVIPLMTALLGGLFFLRQRSLVSQFKIEDDVLVIGKKNYPLRGATQVVRDPEVLKGAWKRFGNGGVGAITGSYSSKKLGKFQVFLSCTENAVVLKWPDKVVAVSPADPEFFILFARKAAGLA